MKQNDIDNLIENTCARATIAFQVAVEEDFNSREYDVWAANRIIALENAIPVMLKTALSVCLNELLKE